MRFNCNVLGEQHAISMIEVYHKLKKMSRKKRLLYWCTLHQKTKQEKTRRAVAADIPPAVSFLKSVASKYILLLIHFLRVQGVPPNVLSVLKGSEYLHKLKCSRTMSDILISKI